MRAALRLATYSALFLIIATDQVYAYLDPGTGSILLQGLLAGIAGGLVVLRLYWAKVKEFLSFNKKKHDKPEKELSS